MAHHIQHRPSGDSTSVLSRLALLLSWGRRRPWLAVLSVVVVAALAAGAYVALREPPVRGDLTADTRTSPPAGWMSGVAADDLMIINKMGEWRGRPIEIAGTWSDNNQAMVGLLQLEEDGELGSWDRPLDIAIGAIDAEAGESWAEAADGAYDDRWRKSLTRLRELREDKSGATYVRFAHEMNGTWFEWSVEPDETQDFVRSWQRFRALQEDIFPDAQLVFCVNRDSSDNDLDWRDLFPGAEHVDVMAVDYYNMFPYVETREEWLESLDETDDYGAPKGLQAHLDFARSVGLPLAVPEWSGSARDGDSPEFIRGMYEFFDANAGAGAGELLYEIHFNVNKDDLNWLLFGQYIRLPESARVYRELW